MTCSPAFILSASVSRGLWLGLYPVGFRVAWLVVRALCHWAVVIAGATAFAAATAFVVAFASAFAVAYGVLDVRSWGESESRNYTAGSYVVKKHLP